MKHGEEEVQLNHQPPSAEHLDAIDTDCIELAAAAQVNDYMVESGICLTAFTSGSDYLTLALALAPMQFPLDFKEYLIAQLFGLVGIKSFWDRLSPCVNSLIPAFLAQPPLSTCIATYVIKIVNLAAFESIASIDIDLRHFIPCVISLFESMPEDLSDLFIMYSAKSSLTKVDVRYMFRLIAGNVTDVCKAKVLLNTISNMTFNVQAFATYKLYDFVNAGFQNLEDHPLESLYDMITFTTRFHTIFNGLRYADLVVCPVDVALNIVQDGFSNDNVAACAFELLAHLHDDVLQLSREVVVPAVNRALDLIDDGTAICKFQTVPFLLLVFGHDAAFAQEFQFAKVVQLLQTADDLELEVPETLRALVESNYS